jgi:DUF3098 family protein
MKQTKTPSAATKKAKPAGIGLLFDKGSMMWMLIALAVMALGFVLMAGGKSSDPNVFDKSQVYGTTRITVAPIVILAGLVLIIVAIFRKPKTN